MATTPPTRSPELRKDPVTNRWVIFSPARAKRPSDFKSKSPENPNNNSSSCPFCIGNEHQCAPEIFRVPPDPNWKLRVIENLYPALSRQLDHTNGQDDDSSSELSGLGRVVPGFGFHDVVIETPVHSVQLSDLDPSEIGAVLIAYKRRIEQIKQFDSIKYIQVVEKKSLFFCECVEKHFFDINSCIFLKYLCEYGPVNCVKSIVFSSFDDC